MKNKLNIKIKDEDIIVQPKIKKVRKPRLKKAVKRACDYCQRRKIRCDNEALENGCSACTKRDIPCTFNNILKRMIKPKEKDLIDSSSITPNSDTNGLQINNDIPLSPDFNWHLPTSLNQCYESSFFILNNECMLINFHLEEKIRQLQYNNYLTSEQKDILSNFYYLIPSELYPDNEIEFEHVDEFEIKWLFHCISATLGFYTIINYTANEKELDSAIHHYYDATMIIPIITYSWNQNNLKWALSLLDLCNIWAKYFLALN